MCSPIFGQFFDTMIVAASDKEWLQQPIKILVLETVWSHLKERLESATGRHQKKRAKKFWLTGSEIAPG